MKNIVLSIVAICLILNSCKKEDRPNLGFLCAGGDVWLANNVDSFHANHKLDSFSFSQGGGYHNFVFTNSAVNKIRLSVFNKPDSGATFKYKKQHLREIRGIVITEEFSYENTRDSIVSITNMGSHYLVSIDSIQIKTPTKNYYLKACRLKMTDILP